MKGICFLRITYDEASNFPANKEMSSNSFLDNKSVPPNSILSPTPMSTRVSNEILIFNLNIIILASKTRMLAFLIADQICLCMHRSFAFLVL